MPKPNLGLLDAYKEIIPAVIKQSSDPDYEIKRIIPV